jgi:tRNA(His) 5'-end guanylyltransferase
MAYYLDIPVITVNNWKPKYFLDTYIESINKYFSGANIETNLDDLEKTIFWVLNNRQIKSKERKKALYEEAGIGFRKMNARKKIIEVIRNLG